MTKTLRQWRLARLMSQRDLAKAAGIASNKTIVQLEHGRQRPHMRTMRGICRALDVRPDEIAEFAHILE